MPSSPIPTTASHFASRVREPLDGRMGDLHVLILGGTGEARALAARLVARPGFRVTLSLAGRTRAPVLPDCEIRVGGFGGAEGLARYLEAAGVGALVDATHPLLAAMRAAATDHYDLRGQAR